MFRIRMECFPARRWKDSFIHIFYYYRDIKATNHGFCLSLMAIPTYTSTEGAVEYEKPQNCTKINRKQKTLYKCLPET